MFIISDENISLVKESFGKWGEVITFSGREINREKLKKADLLLVRSVTKVNKELLAGTGIKFVATATIGTDHIDLAYLKQRGIGFASAPGSNANSVAEYVMTALLCLSRRMNVGLEGKSLGVVGVGHVGSKVAKMAKGLGLAVLENDPAVARETGSPHFKELSEVIQADMVTFHVPLCYEGEEATFHLVDEKLLANFKKGSILINTSRGAVVETRALYRAIRAKRLVATVIDVWENEPQIDIDLLKEVNIATPHIAGYSDDGKIKATAIIYEAAASFFGLKVKWENPVSPARSLRVEVESAEEEVLWRTIRQVYDIERDDQALRCIIGLSPEERGPYFDGLRREYPARREFFNTSLIIKEDRPGLRNKFSALGFRSQKN